jgi:phosphate transport system protein
MPSRLEESLRRDIQRIRSTVIKMGRLAEGALRASLHVLTETDRQLAYSVILKDRYIDELEKELDRLCQEFLIRQQPAAGHLRFVYAVIKINNELERIGDYAESIARHFLAVSSLDPQPSYEAIQEIARQSIPMFRNALQAFSDEDPELATKTMEMEETVDKIRWHITEELGQLYEGHKLPSEAFQSLMIIANRFERVADRACNICEEVLYMCTGEDVKHKGKEMFRVLFVDEHDACRGPMAKGIGNSLGLERFRFHSAGISPQPVDARTVDFLAGKGIDISQETSKYLQQVLDLRDYQIYVGLCEEAEHAFPPPPTKMISVHWEINNPSKMKGSEEEIEAAYEKTFRVLDSHIRDLVEAVLGKQNEKEESL